jgi:hypothetical protein
VRGGASNQITCLGQFRLEEPLHEHMERIHLSKPGSLEA